MLESSPGYALFTDLRRRMGTTSSQPMETPSRVANGSVVASPATGRKAHFNPNMDDVAASLQLMNEGGMRTLANGTNDQDMTLSQTNGSHDPSSPIQKKRKRKSAHKSGKSSLSMRPATPKDRLAETEDPASSPFPFPATQPEDESPAGNFFPQSTAIEVPDSQVLVPSAHAPAASPWSSQIVPSSATKSIRTYKVSKQTKRDRLSRDAMQGDDVDHDGDTTMVADEAASPSNTPSKQKRTQVDDVDSGTHKEVEVAPGSEHVQSSNAAMRAVTATPTPAKRRKLGRPKSATRVRDLIEDGSIHDGIDEDNDLLRSHEKGKLKRIKKPQTPVSKTRDIFEIPDDDLRPTNVHGEAVEANGNAEHDDGLDTGAAVATNGLAKAGDTREANTPKATSIRKPRGSSKKTKDEVPDSAAPVRTPGQPLSGNDEESIMREPLSSDEDNHRRPPPDDNDQSDYEKKQKKKKRRSSTKKATPRRESGKFSYTRKKVPTGTAAERALNVDHELNHPPDLRATGDFTQDEQELIRRAIRDYQQRKGLEVSELVEIIQWNAHDPSFNRGDGTVSGKNDWTPQDHEDARESADFWEEIRHINTERSFDRMRRHIRQTYHQFKSGAWTDEEDERLKNLYAMHPNKWKMISVGMGDRSMHDCQNRWRDYLQYGDKLKSSHWDSEEEELLIRAITTVAQRDEDHRAESGLPPLDGYTTKDINWQQVSSEMDNTRSRIQVVAKWRNLQKRDSPPHIQVEHKPRMGKPRKGRAVGPEPTPKRSRGRPPKVEGETPQGRHNGKSQELIDDSDADEAHTAPMSKKRGRPRKSESSVVKKSKNFRTTETDDIVDNSDEEGLANAEANGSPSKKKRRKSRKSDGMEVEKLKKSRKSEARDDIENSEEEIHANGNTSPPPKKRGRPRKTDHLELEEPEERGASNLAPESVEDLEVREDDQYEHTETNDKPLEDVHSDHAESNDVPVENVQSDPFSEVNGDEPQEDGDGATQKESEEQLGAASPDSVRPVVGPERHINGHSVEPEDMDENEDPIEDEEDQPSVAPNNPADDTRDDQSKGINDSVLADDNEQFSEKDNEHGEVDNQPSVIPSPDGGKPTMIDPHKMQWGDLYDLISKLQERRDEEEGDIDWDGVAEEVATDRDYIWSPGALQTALGVLMDLLRENDKEVDEDDLPGTVDDIMDYISAEHGNEIEEYYDLVS